MAPNMSVHGMIFDVDGTLVDTNAAHVDAWIEAFAGLGYQVPRERIIAEVGQGGDRLVRAILGPEVDSALLADLRDGCIAAFLRGTPGTRVTVFPMVRELFAELSRRGVRTALATSSTRSMLAGLIGSASLDVSALTDVIITADDVSASKPSPDTVRAAVLRLGLAAARCVYIGDTPFDAMAATAAGVRSFGVLSGGYSASALVAAGATGVWRDISALLSDLDRILHS